MELITDTNILLTFFWENSITKKILMNSNIKFFSPEYALEEINKHKPHIINKTKISEEQFKQLRTELAIAVEFIPIGEYREHLKPASQISPDPNDSDFFALALKLKIPIWSNDALLKNQTKIKVLSTSDLLEKNEFFKAVFPDS